MAVKKSKSTGAKAKTVKRAGVKPKKLSGEVFYPPKEVIEQARLKDWDKLNRLAKKDYRAFWEAEAHELEWYGKWKKVLDDSAAAGEKTVLPMQLTVALLPILKFSQSVDDNPMLAELIASLEATGNDKLSITSEAGPRTSTVRIEVQEGIIRLIGNAAKTFGAQFNQQQF